MLYGGEIFKNEEYKEEILTFVPPKNPTFYGLSSLIFPISFRLAIFKLLFLLFCNLQEPPSEIIGKWHGACLR
jgi:hypothetical protein